MNIRFILISYHWSIASGYQPLIAPPPSTPPFYPHHIIVIVVVVKIHRLLFFHIYEYVSVCILLFCEA